MTIRQYSESQNVSYEAVRKQIVRYANELKEHIVRKNRTQYLDEWAVAFLTERRRENPVVLANMDHDEENERLRKEVEALRVQLMAAQNELLKSQGERLKAQERIIELQDEAKKTLEDRARYAALLEDNKAKGERLQRAEEQIFSLQTAREEDLKTIEEREGRLLSIQNEVEALRGRLTEEQRTTDALRKERDDALREAQSFTRSIFGFYRKK